MKKRSLDYWLRQLSSQEERAIDPILSFGKQAVPGLIKAVEDQKDNRRLAALILGLLGPEAQEAIPALIRALKDNDEAVRAEAAESLKWIGEEAQEVIPALCEALTDQSPAVRKKAVGALCTIALQSAVPTVVQVFLEDPDTQVRLMAACYLGEVGPTAAEFVPGFLRALKHVEAAIREVAAKTLAKVSRDEEVVRALLHGLNDPVGSVRVQAAESLEQIGWDEAVTPLLAADLREGDPDVRRRAVQYLAMICLRSEDALTLIFEALRHADQEVRVLAAKAILRCGARVPSSFDAIPTLIECLKDQEPVRQAAAWALADIGASAVPALLEAQESGGDEIRHIAVSLLAIILPSKRERSATTNHSNDLGPD